MNTVNKYPTYIEQYDKLSIAYIKGEVKPYDHCACFIGNLLNNSSQWQGVKTYLGVISDASSDKFLLGCRIINKESNGLYDAMDIVKLEELFMLTYQRSIHNNTNSSYDECHEYALFKAFEAALDFLKNIHQSKGEIIDQPIPLFEKRVLVIS
jgi:hypothetical protein